MSDIQKVHNLHMDVSYDQDHPIYKYIERCADKSKSFRFDRKCTISINRFQRYDMSTQLLKKTIFPSKESFFHQFQKSTLDQNLVKFLLDSIQMSTLPDDKTVDKTVNKTVSDSYDGDVIEMSNHLNKQTDIRVRELIKQYEDHVQDNPYPLIICEWIYDKYHILTTMYEDEDNHESDSISNTEEYIPSELNVIFISTLLFLGTLEWFHLLVIRMMVDQQRKSSNNRCLLISGEETEIEYEYMCMFSMQEIKDFFTSEYNSHATVYLVHRDHITMFDPDEDNKKNRNDFDALKYDVLIDKLCTVLEKEYIPMNLYPSIQTLTDDQYCIFYCVDFILKILEMIDDDYSAKSLKKFMEFMKNINKITKTADIRTFAKTLDLKAKFLEDS